MDRVDEEVFPHSYNPKMTLNMTQTSTQNTRARSGRKKSTVVEDKPTNKAAEVDETLKEEDADPEEAMDEDEDKGDEGGMTEDIAKFDKLIGENSRSAAVGSEQRRSLRMKLSLGDEDGNEADMPSASQADQAISWSDPREEEERRRLKARLAAETQAIGLPASASKTSAAGRSSVLAGDQMTSMEIPENLTEVMMGGNSDDKENSPDRDRAKRKLSLNSNSSGRGWNIFFLDIELG